MLGKGDSDFILEKKKEKRKKTPSISLVKNALIDKTLEHTLRQLKKALETAD